MKLNKKENMTIIVFCIINFMVFSVNLVAIALSVIHNDAQYRTVAILSCISFTALFIALFGMKKTNIITNERLCLTFPWFGFFIFFVTNDLLVTFGNSSPQSRVIFLVLAFLCLCIAIVSLFLKKIK